MEDNKNTQQADSNPAEKKETFLDKAEEAVGKLDDKAQQAWDIVESKAGELWEKAKSGELAESAKTTLNELAEEAKNLWDKVMDKTKSERTPRGRRILSKQFVEMVCRSVESWHS